MIDLQGSCINFLDSYLCCHNGCHCDSNDVFLIFSLKTLNLKRNSEMLSILSMGIMKPSKIVQNHEFDGSFVDQEN